MVQRTAEPYGRDFLQWIIRTVFIRTQFGFGFSSVVDFHVVKFYMSPKPFIRFFYLSDIHVSQDVDL